MITGNEMADMGKEIMKQVMKELKKSASEGGSVNQACKDAITERGLERFVYWYNPTRYIRRYDAGGLADQDNLLTTTIAGGDSVTIDIEDRTPAGDGGMVNPPPDPVFYLSDVIEDGHEGARWQDPDWPGPRPYMEKSLSWQCSASGLITIALRQMLKGITLKV